MGSWIEIVSGELQRGVVDGASVEGFSGLFWMLHSTISLFPQDFHQPLYRTTALISSHHFTTSLSPSSLPPSFPSQIRL